jgi:hypothetical protein
MFDSGRALRRSVVDGTCVVGALWNVNAAPMWNVQGNPDAHGVNDAPGRVIQRKMVCYMHQQPSNKDDSDERCFCFTRATTG